MTFVLALLLVAAPTSCSVSRAEFDRQLALPYEQFDLGEQATAWRRLNGTGCTDEAVHVLASYAVANSRRLSVEHKSELAFHRGQALAFAGRHADAIPHLEEALRIGGTEEWTSYVAANIAFLKRDAAALRSARDHYAAIAPGSMRLKFVDGLLACPDAAYMTAAHCAM